ncbi:MAG: DUF1800 family protein [Opitutaceae bacterium]|nr:DUF1800 family protein [Opitutaceae bacterium]
MIPPILRSTATRILAGALTFALTFALSLPAAPGELVNISVRTRVGTGDGVLVAGFVVSGTGTRPLLVRGVGPTLANFGVPATLDDPVVRVFRSNTELLSNDDWAGNAEVLAAARRLGAFSLPAASRDAAILASLTEGIYTAVASGKSGATGEMLLEVYDAREGTVAAPAISNLSLRAGLPAGGTMITGFAISGSAPKRLLVRAVGPTLERFGIETAHPNPRIRLFTGSTDVAVNDDWSEAENSDEISDTARNAGAFTLSRDSRDAAVLTSLQPGTYTLHISSDDPEAAGVVLVEMYGADPVLAPPAVDTTPAPGLPQVIVYTDDADAAETGDTGRVVFYRSGATTSALTISVQWLGTATPGSDYTSLPAEMTIPAGASQVAIDIVPAADAVLEPPESVVASLQPGTTYAFTALNQAGVLIADGPYTGATGWKGEYFNNNNFTGTPALTRSDAAIDFEWEGASPATGINAENFSVRWTGVIVPPATKDYTFIVNCDDSMRMWIDGQLVVDRGYDWRDSSVTLPLTGGVPHFVKVELREFWGWASCKVWWSASGMSARPLAEVAAPSAIGPTATGLNRTAAIVGEPFVAFIESTGIPTTYVAHGLPPGLSVNATSGVISGTPTAAGDYAVWLSALDSNGGGSISVLLRVIAPGGNATRETFAGAPSGLAVPFGVAPSSTTSTAQLSLSTTDGPFTERIRGYITAPTSGDYRFWLAASGPAEFRFADSGQPGDKIVRARVANTTAAQEWTREPGQASPLLRLQAGQRYYFEIVRAQSASTGHVALGWLQPGQTGVRPFEVVPGYVLSPYVAEAAASDGSTVYLAPLRPPTGVGSAASGVASLALAADQTSATLALRFSGLSSEATNIQVYFGGADAGPTTPVRGLPRSTFENFTWTFGSVADLSPTDLVAALRSGNLFVLIQTADHPTGEIRGQFGPALGSAEFQPPAPPPALASGAPTAGDAARFLNQATFGATLAEIEQLQQTGFDAWFTAQLAAQRTELLPYIQRIRAERRALDPEAGVWTDVLTESWWRAAVDGPDQLRQRMAFALSEIFVVSEDSALGGEIDGLAVYYDLLARHALGNYRDLLRDVTLSPAMGTYLSMLRNRKPIPAEGIFPDENYAREVMQLFSIGLNKLHPDGSLILDSRGLPIPTYTQDTIVGLAHVFTGWTFASNDPEYYFLWGDSNYYEPMELWPEYHDEHAKLLLDGEVLPAGGTGPADLEHVIDMLFRHPNTGPFISRLLIQRLVTSNPSPGYVYRVAQKFADNGQGVRGDLAAVARAILTDWEARSPAAAALPGYGKLREPLIRIAHLWRAFDATSESGVHGLAWIQNWLGQEPMQSPTVFNFFQPDYITPGPTANAGLVAPEFQIATDSGIANTTNALEWLSLRNTEWTDDAVLNLTAEIALVPTPDALLDRLDLVLMAGQMSPELRTRLRTQLTTLPSWVSAADRVRYTIFTLVTSPDYAVQK